MTKKIIGISLLILGGLIFSLGCYRIIENPISKIESVNGNEIYKTVDGKIIEDEQSRKEHNTHVFKMQRLDVELNKTKGLISEYEASLQLLDIETKEKIATVNENKNKELLLLQENSIKAYYAAIATFILIGLGLALGGFFLFKKGRKDSHLSDTIKFN